MNQRTTFTQSVTQGLRGILLLFACQYLMITNLTAKEVPAQSVLDNVISVEFKNNTLEESIELISSITEIKFIYVSSILKDNATINKSYTNVKLYVLLNELLNKREILFEEDFGQIVLRRNSGSNKKIRVGQRSRTDTLTQDTMGTKTELAQNEVSGTIRDAATNEPLLGVSVLVEGTTIGAVSDFNGQYTVRPDRTNAVLVFSYIGFTTQRVTVDGRTTIDIVMQEDAVVMDEVVVMGYGTQKKSNVIGAIASVKSEDINFRSSNSFESSLQGLTSGVSVQTQGGSPGAPSVIRIRGVNSINSNSNPLWVIDGMIMERNPFGIGSSNQSPMSLINEADIESIEVLKDAAATSIYGSRGSSGVIIVTTKKGKGELLQTSVNYTTGVSELSRTPEDLGYADTERWLAIQDLAHQNTFGRNFIPNDHYLRSPNALVRLRRDQIEDTDTNWTKEVFTLGSFQQANVSSSKGFKEGNFYISGSYREEKGVQEHNNFDKLTITSNTTLTPIKNVQLGLKVNLARTDNERRESGTTSIITFALPWFPVNDPTNLNRYYNARTGSNPTAQNDPANRRDNVEQLRALVGTSLEYKVPLIKGLTLRSEFSADIIESNVVQWTSSAIQFLANQEPESSAYEEAASYSSSIFNFYPSYSNTFGKHYFNAVAGYESQSSKTYLRILAGEDLIGSYPQLGTPNRITRATTGFDREVYLKAFFGRFNYTFNEKYLLGFSARTDGSSNFTEKNRWGTFMAYSGGWNLSNEPFMEFLGDNTMIKLRGSYGETGNQDIPNALNTPQYSNGVFYGDITTGANGTLRTNIPNQDLRWETTKSSNVGMDFGFMNNRFSGSLDLYRKYVEDLLLLVPLAWSTGISSNDDNFSNASYDFTSNQITSNVGDMSNTGIEFELRSVNISKPDFSWRTDFNISFNETKVEKLAPFIDENGQGLDGSNLPVRSRTGYKRAVWYLADWAGVDTETGVPKIYTVDRDHFNETGNTRRLTDAEGNFVLSNATTTNIEDNPFYQDGKSIDPTYYGGMTNTFKYKYFDFSFLFSFSGGNYIMDYDRQISTVPNVTRNILSEVLDQSWRAPGDIARYPKITARGEFVIDGTNTRGFDNSLVYHNRELYKGDFVRLRNMTLGCNLPKDITTPLQMKSMRLYVQANNLLLITDYPGFDPEGSTFLRFSSQIPQTRSIIFGVTAQF